MKELLYDDLLEEISKDIFNIYKQSFFDGRYFGDFDSEIKKDAVIKKIEELLAEKIYGRHS
jgi:hypothetical protein